MKSIEKLLDDAKKEHNTVQPPIELEDRLRNAVNRVEKTKRPNRVWKWATVAALVFLFMGYNFNAVAYYGKKLVGFDEIMSDSLKEWNELGAGQILDEKKTLNDGTQLTINGIMADVNRIIIYYTLQNENGLDEVYDSFSPRKITGLFTNSYSGGGGGIFNKEKTEFKGEMEFDPVSPFAKTLYIHFYQYSEDSISNGIVKIPYNPNQAIGTVIKQKVNEVVKVDKGSLHFKSISATPTSTVIEGTINVENFDRTHLGFDGVKLFANGNQIPMQGTSAGGSSPFNMKFELMYDGLPESLDSLQLVVDRFIGYQELDEKIKLNNENAFYDLSGEEVSIKEVRKTEKQVEVTISTDSMVLLDEVYIEGNNQKIPLVTTIDHHEVKNEDGSFNTERTLLFDTNLDPQYLLIGGMHYTKEYQKLIDIPVE